MRRLHVCALTAALAASHALAQVAPHTAGQTTRTVDPAVVLTAYQLTPEMEASFSTLSATASCWWKAWDLIPGLSKGTIQVSDGYAYGPTDKTITKEVVKFAYSGTGCYILWEVHDAQWVGYQNPLDYANDAVIFVIDQSSAETLYTAPYDKFVNLSYSQLTPHSCQLQVRFGSSLTDLPTTLSYNYFNPSLVGVSGLTAPEQFMQYNETVDLVTLEATHGMKLKWLNDPSDSTVRYQEWFFPWSEWGGPNNGGVIPPNPASPKRFAAVLGYNDVDGTTNDYTAIRWRNRADPWTTWTDSSVSPPAPMTSVDCWGDINFADALADKLTAAGKTVADLYCPSCMCWPPDAARNAIARGNHRATPRGVEYFTLTGRKVAAAAIAPASIFIARSAFVNGSAWTRAVTGNAERP